MAPEML